MKRRRTSFTLIELVVATAVFMLVAATAVMALYAGQSTWRRIRQHHRRLNEYIALDRIADTVVRNTVPFKWQNESLADKVVFTGDADFLLLTALRAGHENGAFLFLKLYYNENDKTVVAEYRNAPLLPWLETKNSTPDTRTYPRHTEVVASQVASLKFLYLIIDDNELQNLEDWDEESTDNGNLPVAIQITVTWEDGTVKSWLRRVGGTSCFGKYGN
ncbi:MAG: prepilin-type N-terminal cleavage/methylation domain-containing protein [Victivallales bacterium]|nr:prepilin-type N-terminal cleavage/methylation domain-containing protein [Victivallales bacterium]